MCSAANRGNHLVGVLLVLGCAFVPGSRRDCIGRSGVGLFLSHVWRGLAMCTVLLSLAGQIPEPRQSFTRQGDTSSLRICGPLPRSYLNRGGVQLTMSEGLRTVAELMRIAARTAPKSLGKDFVVIEVIEGETCHELAEAMISFGERKGKPNVTRHARNVEDSPVVVLIGIKNAEPAGQDCSACGSVKCIEPNTFEGEYRGPQCAHRLLDMGIALGSAAKTAGMLNADSRVMYTVGVVAREMGLIDADFVMGIPLSASGKSIYFDRRD